MTDLHRKNRKKQCTPQGLPWLECRPEARAPQEWKPFISATLQLTHKKVRSPLNNKDWIEKVTQINTHHIELHAEFLAKLKATPDGEKIER